MNDRNVHIEDDGTQLFIMVDEQVAITIEYHTAAPDGDIASLGPVAVKWPGDDTIWFRLVPVETANR